MASNGARSFKGAILNARRTSVCTRQERFEGSPLCTAQVLWRLHAPYFRAGAMPSCREFKIMDAQAIFYVFGDPEGKSRPAWRGLVRICCSTIYACIWEASLCRDCGAPWWPTSASIGEPVRLTHHPTVVLKHLVVCFFAIGMHACICKIFLMIWQPFLSRHQAADFQGVQLN